MWARRKKMTFAIYACRMKTSDKQKAVFNRYTIIIHSMPEEHWWGLCLNLFLQAPVFKIFSTATAYSGNTRLICVFPRRYDWICQDHSIGP